MRPRKGMYYKCEYCSKECYTSVSKFFRKEKHYCSIKCYAKDRKENWTREQQPNYTGSTPYEAHRKYVKANPERIKHLKARRYARKKNAEGSHTYQEWRDLKIKNDYRCAECRERKILTKDHIIPLSKGGTDYIDNIQPLCRNCNSKKHNHIYENSKLLKQ